VFNWQAVPTLLRSRDTRIERRFGTSMQIKIGTG
jgi:hypothetical protein